MSLETPSGTINGVNPTFTTLYDIVNEQIFVDRALQVRGTDYLVSGSTITFNATAIPQTGALLRIYYSPADSQSAQPSGYVTAGEIVNDVAAEVGLGVASDPFQSTDANFVQLCRLLKSVGRKLTYDNDWTHLRGEYVTTTVSGQSQYTLPPDWNNMIDQSGWNRTNRLPLGGPLSPQEWQFFKSRLSGVVFNVLFRQMQGRWNLYPDTSTPAGYQIACEYNSKWWVGGALGGPSTPSAWAGSIVTTAGTYCTRGGLTYYAIKGGTTFATPAGVWDGATQYAVGDIVSYSGSAYECISTPSLGDAPSSFPTEWEVLVQGPAGFGCTLDGSVIWKWYDSGQSITTSDAPSASSDVIWFDPTLITRALKLAFLRAKGFATEAAEREYEQVFDSVVDTDRPSPILNLRGRSPFDPLLGIQNIPITGYGQ